MACLAPTLDTPEDHGDHRGQQIGRSAMLRVLCAAVIGAQLLWSPPGMAAESYPTRPVRFIVPGAPGSGTDRVARLVADRLTQAWPHNALVENKPGASGMIGADYVAHAPADGYTALF